MVFAVVMLFDCAFSIKMKGGCYILLELKFFVLIIILTLHSIKAMSVPILSSGLNSLYLLIDPRLLIMQLQIPSCDYVIISEPSCCGLFDFLFLLGL